MCVRIVVFFSICIIPMFAGITGRYCVKGSYPDGTTYKGKLSICKLQGKVYQATWILNGTETDIGTGVLCHNHISFVFNQSISSKYGVQEFSIHGSTLKGPWILWGDSFYGKEICKKKRHHH